MAARVPGRLRLGRQARIKQGRDFARIRREGQRVSEGCLIVNWRKLPSGGRSRLGVITSVKVGGAVVRNRARRLLRECFRLHCRDFGQPVDLVLVARASIANKTFFEVEQDFLTGLSKVRLLSSPG